MEEPTKLTIQILHTHTLRTKSDDMLCDGVDRFGSEDRCAIVKVYQYLEAHSASPEGNEWRLYAAIDFVPWKAHYEHPSA